MGSVIHLRIIEVSDGRRMNLFSECRVDGTARDRGAFFLYFDRCARFFGIAPATTAGHENHGDDRNDDEWTGRERHGHTLLDVAAVAIVIQRVSPWDFASVFGIARDWRLRARLMGRKRLWISNTGVEM